MALGEGPEAFKEILIMERAQSRADMSLAAHSGEGAGTYEDNTDM